MVKFIWDFRGINALETAKHQLIHLVEFMNNNNLNIQDKGYQEINEIHSFCFVTLEKEHLNFIREKLKPHRGLAVPSIN
jgi:hypothetical protein